MNKETKNEIICKGPWKSVVSFNRMEQNDGAGMTKDSKLWIAKQQCQRNSRLQLGEQTEEFLEQVIQADNATIITKN